MASSTVGLIFLILYFLYFDGSNWWNLIKLGLISTLEFQTKWCLHSHFWALAVGQYCQAKITVCTLQTIYNMPNPLMGLGWDNIYMWLPRAVFTFHVFHFTFIIRVFQKWKTHYIFIASAPDYAAVYPGAIINPCQKQPGAFTTTGGDESSTNWNFHWKVLPALPEVMNGPTEVSHWAPFDACSIRVTTVPFW